MIKKTAICLCGAIIFCVFTGCSAMQTFSNDSQEYIVSSVGFDEGENKVEIVMEILVVNADDMNEGKEKRIFEASGKTVKEAYYKLISNTTQPVTLTHNGIVAIGKSIKSERFKELLEFCSREPQFNVGTMFVYTEDCRKLLNKNPLSSISVGYDILSMLEVLSSQTGVKLNNKFYEIRSILKKKNKTFYIPIMKYQGEEFYTDGMAIFKDNEFVYSLNTEEMQLMSFLTDRVSKGEFILENREFFVDYSKTTYKFKLDGALQCTVNLRLKADGNRETLEKRLTHMLEDLRGRLGDVFGFENIIYQKNREIWKKIRDNYHSYFKTAKLKVNIYE